MALVKRTTICLLGLGILGARLGTTCGQVNDQQNPDPQIAAIEQTAQASRMTLADSMDLQDLLKEIEKQTGNRVLDYRNRFGEAGEMTVSLKAKDEEFWRVLDGFLPRKGLVLYPFPGEPNSVAIIADPSHVGQPIVSIDRAVRVEATKLFAVRDLRDPFQTGLRLNLEIVWEPRLKPIFVKHHLDKFQAKDDQGQLIRSTTQGQVEAPVLAGVSGIECTIPMELPSRQASRLVFARGETEVFFPGEIVRLEIPDLSVRGATAEVGDLKVLLEHVEVQDDILDVRLKVMLSQPSDRLPSHYSWIGDGRVSLRGPDGKILESIGSEMLFQKKGESGTRYNFELADPKGWALLYETPSVVVPLTFKFEFTDVLLP